MFSKAQLRLIPALVVPLCCQGQGGRFSRETYPVLESAACRDCHNSNGVASASRLHFPDRAASPEQVEAFGESLGALVDRARPEESLLLRKPTQRVPHTGGRRIAPASPEEETLRAWVLHLATLHPVRTTSKATLTPAAPSTPPLRRLTHSQYDHTLRDLLGETGNPSAPFPPEDYVNGFKNQYEAQSISPLLAEAYGMAAEKLAASAVRKGTFSCTPGGADCRTRFVREFGRKVFRRPLDEDEVRRYLGLFPKLGEPARAAQTVIEAMLQSPSFLYWGETEPGPRGEAYARAARLSYFLWDSMPDDALLGSAAAGELDTAEGAVRAARRLLADPKARRSLDQFVSQWLQFDRVVSMVKERRSFPQFTREAAFAMTEETRRFLEDLVWNDGNFMEMFSAGHTIANADLASIYGLPPPADFARLSYAPGSGRAGILGHATFLALTAKPAETSPTGRGLFVREHFLCQNVPQPPPGVSTSLPRITEEKPLTNRDRLAVHLANESCASCHRLIDPIGFGFERFDAIGARHEKVKVTIPVDNRRQQARTVELEVDTRGWIAGIPDSEFSSPAELGRILASNRQCQECVVKQLFRYAMGRMETPADRPVIERVYAEFRDSQFRFKQLMISLVRWTEFPPKGS